MGCGIVHVSQIFQRRKSNASNQYFDELNLFCVLVRFNKPPKRDLNQGVLYILVEFGGSSFNQWSLLAWRSTKSGIFYIKLNLTLKFMINEPQNNMYLNKSILQFWSKFDDSSLKWWQVIAQKILGLNYGWMNGQTDEGNYNKPTFNWHWVTKNWQN